MEMALGAPIILTALLLMIYNFLGPLNLAIILPLIYLYSLLHGLIFPRRVIKPILPWALVCGAAVFLINLAGSSIVYGGFWWGNVSVSLGMVYLIFEFGGWSPILKYSLLRHPKARIRIEKDRCSGCRRCQEVCPMNVFAMVDGKAEVFHEDRCVLCKSCFRQCQSGAIVHSAFVK